MEGWVDLGDRLQSEMVHPPTDGHPSKYYNPAVQLWSEKYLCYLVHVKPSYVDDDDYYEDVKHQE